MELQEMKTDEVTPQEEKTENKERKPEGELLEGKKVDLDYTTLGIPAEDVYSEPSFPRPSATAKKDFQRRAHLYRRLCVILSVLFSILLLVVIILCVKLQSQSVCHDDNDIPGVRVSNLCTPEVCGHVCSVKETSQALPCSKCDAGWQQFEDSCFYLSHDLSTWGKSREDCRKMDGDLVVLGDPRLQEFLVKKGNMAYWIGVIQFKTGMTVWVNSTEAESFWAQSQIEGECGYLNGGGSPSEKWHTSPCSRKTTYICQKNA